MYICRAKSECKIRIKREEHRWQTLTHESNDEQFAQKQKEIRHFVQHRHPKEIQFSICRITHGFELDLKIENK